MNIAQTPKKQSLLDQYKDEIWYWNSTPVKLVDLKEGQIKAIKKVLNNSKNPNWFGKTRDYWNNAINMVVKDKSIIDLNRYANTINQVKTNRYYSETAKVMDKMNMKIKSNYITICN